MKAIACVTLECKGKQYYFEDEWTQFDGWDEDDYRNAIEFWWDEGNGACDCNRSLLIQQYCDPGFPELKCGDDMIEMIDITVKIIE